jgi:hypothetical protein
MDAAANPWARNSLPLNHGAKKASSTVGASSQGTNKDVTIPRISEASGSGDQDSSMLSAVQIDDVILVYDPRLVYEPSDDSFLFLDTLNRKMFRDAFIISFTVAPSVIITASSIPASAASITASATNAGGTKIILTVAPIAFTASSTVL